MPHQSGSPGGPAPRRANAQPVAGGPGGPGPGGSVVRGPGGPVCGRARSSARRAVVMVRFIRAGSATRGGAGPRAGRESRPDFTQPWPIAMPSALVTVTQMVVWGLRAAVAARARHRAGSRVPRPCPSPGRSARPRRVASGNTRSVSVGGGPSGGRRNGDRGAGGADPGRRAPAPPRRGSPGCGWPAASRAGVAGTAEGGRHRVASPAAAVRRRRRASFGRRRRARRRPVRRRLGSLSSGSSPSGVVVGEVGSSSGGAQRPSHSSQGQSDPPPTGASPGASSPGVAAGVAAGGVVVAGVVRRWGVVGVEPPVGDPILSRDVVEDVQVGGRPQPVHPLLREHAGLLVHLARAFTCANAASVWSAGRSRPDRAAAPDRSRNIVTRDRCFSAAFRRRSARSGSTSAAIAVASRSTWV